MCISNERCEPQQTRPARLVSMIIAILRGFFVPVTWILTQFGSEFKLKCAKLILCDSAIRRYSVKTKTRENLKTLALTHTSDRSQPTRRGCGPN